MRVKKIVLLSVYRHFPSASPLVRGRIPLLKDVFFSIKEYHFMTICFILNLRDKGI
ncbi:hypothetical protein VU01_11673 [Candidatus Electrothrix marina]|uniref:Uncharacterized protein n=1 Tax=Candidatus Electrothrix marina TaxID=1859130 RepID=A0A444JE40_9BACT|nr:hypothetical protein VU01_11673 [Candidatus Electrothrix marina]